MGGLIWLFIKIIITVAVTTSPILYRYLKTRIKSNNMGIFYNLSSTDQGQLVDYWAGSALAEIAENGDVIVPCEGEPETWTPLQFATAYAENLDASLTSSLFTGINWATHPAWIGGRPKRPIK